MRKILIIIIGLILLGGVGWYFYSRNSTSTQGGVPSITDFSSFFPVKDVTDPSLLGDGVVPAGVVSSSTTEAPVASTPTALSKFKQLTPHPVAGFTAYTEPYKVTVAADPTNPKSKQTTETRYKHLIRYVSRTSGYVYEIEDSGVPLQVSNVYIPNIYEAVFGSKNQTALLRFLRDDMRTIATYSVPIPPLNPDGTRTQKAGVYLPDNLQQIAVSPDGSQVARLSTDAQGTALTLSTPTNTGISLLLRQSFSEWLLTWGGAKTLYLQTKASAQALGYLYKVDTTEKKLRRVVGDINGLTTSVSPSGTYVLYSQSGNNGFVTKLLNTKTNTTRTLNLSILPEKCAWLQNEDLLCAGNTFVAEGTYPDDWYKGVISFNDALYRIYTNTITYETIYDGTERSFDMTNLAVDETNSTLYFIDKPTGILWQVTY